MRASLVIVRLVAARSWKGLLFLAIVTALTFGFVLSAATAARRTTTSFTRLLDATDSPEVVLTTTLDDTEVARTELERDPAVAAFGAMTFLPVSPEGATSGLFAPMGRGFGDTVVRPVILEGRLPDQTRVDEVVINQAMADQTGLRVGGRTRLRGPFGIEQPVSVVGRYLSPLDVGPNGGAASAVTTPAFTDRWFPVLLQNVERGALRPSVLVRLRPDTDIDRFITKFRAAHPEAGVEGPDTLDVDVADGLRTLSSAYWILAAVASVASLAVILLVSGRATRTRANATNVLGSLGATRSQRALAASMPETLAVAAGVLVAPVVAIVASAWARTGFARDADPDRGVWYDGRILVLLTMLALAALVGATLLQGWRAQTPAGTRLRRRRARSSIGLGSPALFLGIRRTFGREPASRRQSRAALLGTVLAVAGIVGVLMWTASVDHLLATPRLYGWDFDAQLALPDADAPANVMRDAEARLVRSSEIAGVRRVQHFLAGLAGTDTDVFATEPVRGRADPTIVAGRLPTARDEIALSSVTMDRIDAELGGDVLVTGAQRRRFRIVGEVIPPHLGNATVGDAAMVTAQAQRDLALDSFGTELWVKARTPGALDAIRRVAGPDVSVNASFPPTTVARLDQIDNVDVVLIVFLAALGLIVLTFHTVTASRRQAKTTAIARALGLRRTQVFAAFGWQAAIEFTIAAVLAVPAGILAGRVFWEFSTRTVRVLNPVTLPGVRIAVLLAVAALAAALGALLAARASVRTRVAEQLHAE
jgi:hypothetical protein